MSNNRLEIEEVLMRDTEIKQNFLSLNGKTWRTRKFNTPIQKSIQIEEKKFLKLKSKYFNTKNSKNQKIIKIMIFGKR